MISGAVPAALHYETRNGLIVKDSGDLDVFIQLYVVPVMTLSHDSGAVLNFGRVCASSLEQTLTVAADGSISSHNLECETQDTSTDSFTVEGVTGSTFTVNLPPAAILFGSHQGYLTLSDLTSTCPPEGCTIESGSSKQFHVGATLTVPADPIGGRYSGTYTVSITY